MSTLNIINSLGIIMLSVAVFRVKDQMDSLKAQMDRLYTLYNKDYAELHVNHVKKP